MRRKERAKGFIFGVVLTLLLVSTVGVFAAGQVSKKIDVIYNNIKLVVDGKPVSFGKDAAGSQIEPFIYNGTTYLPVRAVGDAIGKNVDWDGGTQTVYLGEKLNEISYMTEVVEPYKKWEVDIYRLNDTKNLNMGGLEYKTGYNFIKTGSATDPYAYFNLNGKYNTMSGYLGNDSSYDISVSVYLDEVLYDTIILKESSLPKKIDIPVNGVNQLLIKTTGGSKYTIGFGDIILK